MCDLFNILTCAFVCLREGERERETKRYKGEIGKRNDENCVSVCHLSCQAQAEAAQQAQQAQVSSFSVKFIAFCMDKR